MPGDLTEARAALLRRLVEAQEGSRELNVEIALAARGYKLIPGEWRGPLYEDSAGSVVSEVPAYTTSLDAALTLVPPEYAPNYLGEMQPGIGKHGPFHALLWRRDGMLLDFEAARCNSAASIPLAVCVAALIALAAQAERVRP